MIDIRKQIQTSDAIANLPAIAMKILEVINDQDSSIQDLSNVIITSPALTTRLLKVVNSSFYGFEKEISNITQAISIMGMNSVANIVLSVSIIDSIQQANLNRDLTLYWEKSFFTAMAAKLIAKNIKCQHAEEAFISGLLSNISYIFILQHFPEHFNRLMQQGIKELEKMALEWEFFGMTHAEMSYLLLEKSEIPRILSKPVEFHHTVKGSVTSADDTLKQLCKIVYSASKITILFYDDPSILGSIKNELSDLLSIPPSDFQQLTGEVTVKVKEISEFYGFSSLKFPSYFEILERSNTELTKINQNYEELLKELKKEKENTERLASKLEETNRKLLEIALKDPLTGAYNRRYLNEILDRKMAEARRYGTKLLIIYCDIDHFKHINDTYGHNNGDIVLKRLVMLLKMTIRNTDVLARTGGEEFTIVCQATNIEDGIIVAEKLRQKIESTPMVLSDNKEITVTMSFGVAMYENSIHNREDFIKIADDRLYKAKESGRNKVVYN